MTRAIWVVLHRWAGLALAFFLFVAGLTGSILAFYGELDGWLNPDLLQVRPRQNQMLDLDTLARQVEAAVPHATATSIRLPDTAGDSVAVGIEARTDPATGKPYDIRDNEAYVDPYDGRYLGARELGSFGLDPPRLMSFIYSIHYSLHLPGVWGWWVMGVAAIVWLFDNFIGAYLTFPLRRAPDPARADQVTRRLDRGWWARWAPAWQIKWGGSGYRITFDLHRATGLWLWLLLGMLAFTSIYLNLPREVFNPVVNLVATVVPEPEEFPNVSKSGARMSFTQAVATARDALPVGAADLQPILIYHDTARGVFRVDFGHPNSRNAWFRVRHEKVYLDAVTGAVAGRAGTVSGGAGDRFNAVLFPLHSGHILGLAGRILICIAGLVIAVLSVTGVMIWNRKRKARSHGARRNRTV